MYDATSLTQLGVSGVIVAILLVILKVVWGELQKVRVEQREDQRANREDQRAMLPALTEATAAISGAVKAIDHVSRLYDNLAPPRGRGEN